MNYTKFKGLYAAVFTPFTPCGKHINTAIIPDYCNDLIKQSTYGAYVCGVTGESMSMTVDERKEVLEAWMDTEPVKKGEFKVFANISNDCLNSLQELNEHAQSLKVDAIVMSAPTYFKVQKPGQLSEIFIKVAQQCKDTPFFYHHLTDSVRKNINIVDELQKASLRCDNICGLKYSSTNFREFQQLIDANFQVLNGHDHSFVPALEAGAVAGIGTTYNYSGKLYTQIQEHFNNNTMRSIEAQELIHKSLQLYEIFGPAWNILRYQIQMIRLSKALMPRLRGIDLGPVRYPLSSVKKEEIEKMQSEINFYTYFN